MQENETAATAAAEETTESATEATEVPAAESTADETTETQEQTATEENTTAETEATPEAVAEPEEEEEITYHAVQKDGSVTAIWEMQGQKHLRTIDPRSREGAEILRLFTEEESEEAA